MDHKKIRKGIGRFFGWLVLSFCSLIIRRMPVNAIYGFAKFIAGVGFMVARKQRKIAIEGLTLAFGAEKNAHQIQKIARDCFVCMAKSGVEIIFFTENFSLASEKIQLIGREYLEEALSRKKGVILASGHFGNFPMILLKLALAGYKSAGIMRPMRDRRVEKMFLKRRENLNIRTIYSQPRKACVEESIRALRNNELLFIPVDQNFGTGGVFVDFFGLPAATAIGPVVLAQRTKAAILPCFIVRQPDDTHKIIFEPILELQEGTDSRQTVIMNIQKLTGILESYIRRYPEQWGWIHRRWKSKPAS